MAPDVASCVVVNADGASADALSSWGLFLLLNGCYTGEYLAFDGLEKSAATGRNVAYLVSETELVDASHRVTATYEREGAVVCSFNDSVGNGA